MKKNPSLFSNSRGFTLVELLVVIVIVATLAAISFTVGPKMMRNGEAAKSVQNMRQIGSVLMTYAVDNNSKLPPPRGEDSSGNEVHWHQALLALTYPDVDTSKFNDKEWWNNNNPFLKNPLMKAKSKPNAFEPWFPGYAMNREIATNLGLDNGDWGKGKGGPQTQGIPLGSISDTARTPVVVPRYDWHYIGQDLVKTDMEFLLVEGKLPVLFVDGHAESMRPQEYLDRHLDQAPTFKK
ncbi:MAG: prepilin-type N-terminal cleavage/methylation domain-containing protein [Verrucomicrobiaceae bacterium]|nr:MAG: prepilin-type N-terminal cleavage/methylation domain-containing protein [Verrucomicrobiaceae bacterium]